MRSRRVPDIQTRRIISAALRRPARCRSSAPVTVHPAPWHGARRPRAGDDDGPIRRSDSSLARWPQQPTGEQTAVRARPPALTRTRCAPRCAPARTFSAVSLRGRPLAVTNLQSFTYLLWCRPTAGRTPRATSARAAPRAATHASALAVRGLREAPRSANNRLCTCCLTLHALHVRQVRVRYVLVNRATRPKPTSATKINKCLQWRRRR